MYILRFQWKKCQSYNFFSSKFIQNIIIEKYIFIVVIKIHRNISYTDGICIKRNRKIGDKKKKPEK